MVLWRVPLPVPPSVDSLKYSLFYGGHGVRNVGYDTERGKGDHRHFQGIEIAYVFSTVEQLIAVHERDLAFESWEALVRILSGKRMELLHYVRWHNVTSVRALAKALSRDYSNVNADVQALATAGLLESANGSLRADYDAIETRIAI